MTLREGNQKLVAVIRRVSGVVNGCFGEGVHF